MVTHPKREQTVKMAIATAILLRTLVEDSCTWNEVFIFLLLNAHIAREAGHRRDKKRSRGG